MPMHLPNLIFRLFIGVCLVAGRPLISHAAPPSIEQVNAALDIAEAAADNGLTSLSVDAVERCLRFGPPSRNATSESLPIVHRGARVDTDRQWPKSAAKAIRQRIPDLIFRLSRKWDRTADPVKVYAALRSVVLPPERPGEVYLYNVPMVVNPLQPDRLPAVRSVAQELVAWSVRAGATEQLAADVEKGYSESLEGTLLLLLTALETNRVDVIRRQSNRLTTLLPVDAGRRRAEMLTFVGLRYLRHGRYADIAASLLEAAGRTLAGQDSVKPQQDSVTRAVLLAAAKCRFSQGQNPEAVSLLRQYLELRVRGKHGISSNGLTERKYATVARELYRRGLVQQARRLLGSVRAHDFERRLAESGLLQDASIPATTSASQTKTSAPARVIRLNDGEPPTIHRSHVWICSLDTRSGKSKELWALPDFQDVDSLTASPDGSRLAFDATFHGEVITSGKKICVLGAGDSAVHVLGDGALPSWSPEGHRLAFSRYSPQRGVWVCRSDGGPADLIDETGWSATWSSNGRMIAYIRLLDRSWNLMVHDLAEDEFFSVFPGRAAYTEIFEGFTWSADSRRIVFGATVDVAPITGDRINLFSVPVLGPRRRITRWNATTLAKRPLRLCRQNNSIICVRKQPETGREALYLLEPDETATPEHLDGQLTKRRNTAASWLPDGHTLVYVSKPSTRQ